MERIDRPSGFVLNAALAHFGFKAGDISRFSEVTAKVGTFREQIDLLAGLARHFGFTSTYILIDKIDETPITGNKAGASLQFVAPLLSDLALLESKNFCLKFFLWDQMADEATAITRRDRIKHYALKWSTDQLMQMLSARLAASSGARINSLEEISSWKFGIDLDAAVVLFCGGSPRNIIRICKSIFDQQSEIDADATSLSPRAISRGIEMISAELAKESMPVKVLQELRKLQRADFTVRNVYADVFKISQPAGISKVQTWQDSGAVIKAGSRQESRSSKPSSVYSLASPTVAKFIFSELSFVEFLQKKVMWCGSCREILLRDWEKNPSQLCHACEGVADATAHFAKTKPA